MRSSNSQASLSSIEEGVQDLPEMSAASASIPDIPSSQPDETVLQSRILLASWILKNNKIQHVPLNGSFVVTYSNKNSLVELYPVEKCSCVQRRDCAHILAVKMSIGIKQPTVRYDRDSLTVLRRNANNNVKGGRKGSGHAANSE
jgi:hypothetical protein